MTDQPKPVFAPISLVKAADVIPVSYIIHTRETHCLHCGTISHSSDVYALQFLRSKLGAGKPVQNLVPVTDRFQYNVPVVRKPLGTRRVPACHECETIDLSHLPLPPAPEKVIVGLSNKDEKTPAKTKAEPKRPATLDELA